MPIGKSTCAALFVLAAATAAGAGQQANPPAAVPPKAAPAPGPNVADFKLVKTPAIHAVVLPMKGSYMQHQSAFERVDAFLTERSLPRTQPLFGRYFNDPSVGEANLAWEVGSPVPAGVTAQPPLEIKDIPGGLAVVYVHRGPYEELGTSWSALMQWAITNGHPPAGPTLQVYNTLMPPEIELRLPVQK